MRERLLALVALAAIATGGALSALGEPGWADVAWGLGAGVVLVPLTVDTVRSLLRGDVGVDTIALVAIVTALLLGEQLAAAIVALMMSGGAALEARAVGRTGSRSRSASGAARSGSPARASSSGSASRSARWSWPRSATSRPCGARCSGR